MAFVDNATMDMWEHIYLFKVFISFPLDTDPKPEHFSIKNFKKFRGPPYCFPQYLYKFVSHQQC